MKAITPLVLWVVKWLRHWPTRESYFQVVSSGMDKLPNYNGGAIQGPVKEIDLSRRESVWDMRQHRSETREIWWHHLSPSVSLCLRPVLALNVSKWANKSLVHKFFFLPSSWKQKYNRLDKSLIHSCSSTHFLDSRISLTLEQKKQVFNNLSWCPTVKWAMMESLTQFLGDKSRVYIAYPLHRSLSYSSEGS